MPATHDDRFTAWARELRKSNEAAFAELFEATYDALFHFAISIVQKADAAHDVLQNTYMKLWQIRESVDHSLSLKALMYQMARNYALNHERQDKLRITRTAEPFPENPVSPDKVEDELEAEVLGKHIARWVDELPDRRREAFILSRHHGLTHDEIAHVMNLTSRTVGNHISLALQDLRDRLQKYRREHKP